MEVEEGTTSAVHQVQETFGVPVVSVVGMSHLTEYMASKEEAAGVNAQVNVKNSLSTRGLTMCGATSPLPLLETCAG